jgi:hypothetical protein
VSPLQMNITRSASDPSLMIASALQMNITTVTMGTVS